MDKKTRNSIVAIMGLVLALIFNGCTKTTPTKKTVDGPVNNGKIAYVKVDSLVVNYYLTKDLNDEFLETSEAYNKEFAAKKTKMTKDAQAFQVKYQRHQFATQASMMKERERIVAMEKEVKKMDYELSTKLSKIQSDNNKRVTDSLNVALDHFQELHHYKYILNGAAVLRAEGADNITSEVLKILNATKKK
ncbi:MAG: OmpH family outer membrane protein [Prolixibacteraceae bacterium]|jgi:outer membrane protein|nr:OmpH family outer membrane protein [Prolixibacteraceae bacterium]